MRQLAADTAGLMNVLRIQRVAMLGISMGGMIAQEFALNHPERLSCLILACTHFGGKGAIQPSAEMQAAVAAGAAAASEQRRLQLKAKAWRSRRWVSCAHAKSYEGELQELHNIVILADRSQNYSTIRRECADFS